MTQARSALTLTLAARGLPMTPGAGIVEDFALLAMGRRILAAGPRAGVLQAVPAGMGEPAVRDLGAATLAPGLVNAHVHLEMAHMAGRTVSGQGFLPWIKSLVSGPLYTPDEAAMDAAAASMRDTGTACVADIATRSAGVAARVLERSGLAFLSFHEVIGQGPVPQDGPLAPGRAVGRRGRTSLAGHALYSTAPEVLVRAKGAAAAVGLPFSLHLAEHADEVSLLADGSGPFADLLTSRGFLKGFTPPGTGPVAQAERLGILDEKTLCVHCVMVGDEDIKTLARHRASVCLCPRSNETIGVGRAPWEKFLDAGLTLCLGTDSLASNRDLDLWNEVRYLKEGLDRPLDLVRAVDLATASAARALGLDQDFGSLAPGKAAVVSVVPEDLLRLFE